ncbi:MAG: AarF/ABC1/UbiB kinase family protein [Verrucomicrobia bacterium]|nr:AarF/ABC1/UbiB kinase family protein [Verrucomicrobiota bacterium]
MNLSLKPSHLKRYKEIALLFGKYANPDLARQFNKRAELAVDLPSVEKQAPEELTNELERMGPTFIKLGQILSSRADLLPQPYLDALSRLQDKVKPFSYAEVEEIISSELGGRISKMFKEFESEPLAAASLGQVHRAILRSGKPVVVKVQRPDIRKQIAEDLEVLEEITSFMDEHFKVARRYQFSKIFEEFQKTLIRELDYSREAASMVTIGKNLAEFPNIVVPQPVMDYCSRGVLTMDYITGKKIPDITPLERTELQGFPLADELFRAYLKQTLVDGIFHADPHPGNVFLTEDKKIALLDLGMVGRISPEMQEKLIKLLIAIADGKGDTAAELAIQMSQTTEFFREDGFRRAIASIVADQQDTTLEKIDVGRILLEIGKAAGESGLYVPVELTMLGKALLQLDEIGRALDEKFSPQEAVRRHVSAILNERLQKEITPRSLFSSVLEIKDFVSGLPHRVNKILDTVGSSDFEMRVKVPQIDFLIDGFQKVANRITTGLILASLIVGAALLMQVETEFQMMGYPGFAMICFLAAAGLGFWLVISIMFGDHRTKEKSRAERKG